MISFKNLHKRRIFKKDGDSTERVPIVKKINANLDEKYFLIPPGGLVFGRNPKLCSVVFRNDEKAISRVHCRVTFNKETSMFIIEDLMSSFGIYTSTGIKTKGGQIVALNDGDCFHLGSTDNTFRVEFREKKQND